MYFALNRFTKFSFSFVFRSSTEVMAAARDNEFASFRDVIGRQNLAILFYQNMFNRFVYRFSLISRKYFAVINMFDSFASSVRTSRKLLGVEPASETPFEGFRGVSISDIVGAVLHHLLDYRIYSGNMLKEHREDSESPATGDVSMVGGKTSTGVCAACCQCIEDRFYLLAVDRQWHLACLQCHQCKLPLHTQLTCYSRHGNIYCKEDYYRLFGIKRCARCQNGISSRELVMRARDDVYHVHCFTCASCGVRLAKGDHFGVRDGLIYCRPHYEALRHRDYFGPVEFEPLSPGSFWSNAYTGGGLSAKGRPRKRKTSYICEDVATDLTMLKLPPVMGSSPVIPSLALGNGSLCVEMLHSSDLSSSMESLAYDSSSTTSPTSNHADAHAAAMAGAPQPRTKRMRTSFKHHQLRTMKSYFNVNQNPDAKDLKQLSQKTGLSKRVLQVWFQNARAKWRRNLMRQEASQSGANGVNILPMRTSSSDLRVEESCGARLMVESNGLSMDDYSQGRQQTNSNQPIHFEELY